MEGCGSGFTPDDAGGLRCGAGRSTLELLGLPRPGPGRDAARSLLREVARESPRGGAGTMSPMHMLGFHGRWILRGLALALASVGLRLLLVR